jgi:hypothetical protein
MTRSSSSQAEDFSPVTMAVLPSNWGMVLSSMVKEAMVSLEHSRVMQVFTSLALDLRIAFHLDARCLPYLYKTASSGITHSGHHGERHYPQLRSHVTLSQL